MKLVLEFDCKFSVGHIQTGKMDFLPPQDCRRSWQECWLNVTNLRHQLIDLIDLKSNSSSSNKPIFVDCWPVYIIFTGLAFIYSETCPQVWVQIIYRNYKTCTYGIASQFCSYTCYYPFIDWLQGSFVENSSYWKFDGSRYILEYETNQGALRPIGWIRFLSPNNSIIKTKTVLEEKIW